MNGRWFDERQLKCYYWDGKKDFKVVQETKESLERRIEEFGAWLGENQLQNNDEL